MSSLVAAFLLGTVNMNPNDVIPPEMLSKNASNDMLLFTAFLAVMISIAMIYLGLKGKQMWMVVWSVGLIFMSLFMAGSILFGWSIAAW